MALPQRHSNNYCKFVDETPNLMKPNELERLLKSHGPALQLYAQQWANSPEDCVQQAFISLATTTEEPDNPVAWLFRVVRNRAISQTRTRLRRAKRETEVGLETEVCFQANLNHELDPSELSHAMACLDESTREIVIARIWGQLSFEEIASLVECSSSSAHRKYNAGLNELRKTLGLTWLIKN
jgi:RNA polymerase sigma-70 factor (ECF subfamily)